jgi:hypothetical protein
MSASALLEEANAAGVTVSLEDGELAYHSEGIVSVRSWMNKLAPHEQEIVDHLSGVSTDEKPNPVRKYTFAQLAEKFPELHPPIIDGLLREGETANIIAPPKFGKSWLVYLIALSVAFGLRLFGFTVTQGRVLIVDNELHEPTLHKRIRKVATQLGIDANEIDGRLDVWCLRGNLRSINRLMEEFEELEPGYYKTIICDAKYRFPTGGSENDNSSEAAFYNDVDRLAAMTRAAVILVHHSTKGSQSDKKIVDVGAGGGSQARAADCHAVLREHAEPDKAVLEAAVRSFPPVDPVVLRWEYPLWTVDHDADPALLKLPASTNEKAQERRDKDGKDLILKVLLDSPATARTLRTSTQISRERLERLLAVLESEGHITSKEVVVMGNKAREYSIVESQL